MSLKPILRFANMSIIYNKSQFSNEYLKELYFFNNLFIFDAISSVNNNTSKDEKKICNNHDIGFLGHEFLLFSNKS